MSALPPYDPTRSNRNPKENTVASSATVGSTSTTTAKSTAVASYTIPSINAFNRANPSTSLQSPLPAAKTVTIHNGRLPECSAPSTTGSTAPDGGKDFNAAIHRTMPNTFLQPPGQNHPPDVTSTQKRPKKTFTFELKEPPRTEPKPNSGK